MTSSKNFNATDYWNRRYEKGNHSGDGSYGKYAEFKAEIINNIIHEHDSKSLIEFGCGDGNQLGLIDIEKYIGLDVSKKAIDMYISKYSESETEKSFLLYDPFYFYSNGLTFDISMSLEVIFHIIDDEIYRKYLYDLFSSSHHLVIIFSSNFEEYKGVTSHIKHRAFTDYISSTFTNWDLLKYIKNPHKDRKSNFYIYKRTN